MNINKIIITITAAVLICGCNPLSEQIDRNNLKNDISKIKAKNPELPSNQIQMLDELVILTEGRDAYCKSRSHMPSDLVVPEPEFEKAVAEFFDYCKENNITYEELLAQMEQSSEISKIRQPELDKLEKEVDEICPSLKKEWDDFENHLNSIAKIRLIKINTIDAPTGHLVQLDLNVTNKTNQPINAIQCGVRFNDKFGKEVTFKKLIGSTTIRSNSSQTLYFPFYEKDDPETYNLFRGKNPDMYNIQYQILKINHGGEIMPEGDGLFFHYHSDPLPGYCPYITSNHELKMKEERISSEIKGEVKQKCPAWNALNEVNSKVLTYMH